ncbi:MAG: type VI secretion system baseplate subunit TssK [Chitinophagaceae bacterium]
MRDNLKHYPVNWVDGMKINKDLFIAQDNASLGAMQDFASMQLSAVQFGVLPPAADGGETFNVKIALDNQNTIRATVHNCQAVTSGGIRINVPGLGMAAQSGSGNLPATTFEFAATSGERTYWIFLIANPFNRQPTGSPDTAENPPRFPYVQGHYELQVIGESAYKQFANNPYALAVGKVLINGSSVVNDEGYIPPCYTINAHPDLANLLSEIDQFFGQLEMKCSVIVQKIFKKSQQNDLSELVMYLCDRTILFLGPTITQLRWFVQHQSPAVLLSHIASLARVMKNTIDLRIGSGKDELMNYLSEWCELKQGELESMLSSLATLRYDHNDVNQNIEKIARFVRITGKLFESLSNLEFIGKRKEVGFFVKEEQQTGNNSNQGSTEQKARRRFFG